MAGIDAHTGQAMSDGWAHTQQSLRFLWTTRLGERVMVRQVGNRGLENLGRGMTPTRILALFQALTVSAELFEPRFKVTKITPLRASVGGALSFEVAGDYRPRALSGDLTVASSQVILLGPNTLEGP